YGYSWSPRYHYYPAYYYPVAGSCCCTSSTVTSSMVAPSTVTSSAEPAAIPTAAANTATIRMHVPSGARGWLEGTATSSGGADRAFVSPALAPGSAYVYHVRVQWEQNGQTVERERDVMVHAGDQVSVTIDS